MCIQIDVLWCKFYDVSLQIEDFDYLFMLNKKVVEFDEEFFRNSDDKVLFYIGFFLYEILNFVFEFVLLFVFCCF